MNDGYRIDPDIRRARTPPGWVYDDRDEYERQLERVFRPSWQYVADADAARAPCHVLPSTLLAGSLDEPVVLTVDERGERHCLSNVCTHRGALVVEGEGHVKTLRCRYHGRRFSLDGRFAHMPEFDGVEGFPSADDDLPRWELERWGPLMFAASEPDVPFETWIAPVRERMDWLPLDRFEHDPDTSRDYLVAANWALYCDNYLEEFHIPYVHQGSLTGTLDYDAYRTELFDWSNLQLGVAREGEPAFELPEAHPDAGERVAAFYFWLFPNTMLNFYPWGLSLNVVQPLGPGRTRVSFRSYVLDPTRREEGAGAALHTVEMEDEEIVLTTQKGLRSARYRRGRYSPRRERGLHHFHRLLARSTHGA